MLRYATQVLSNNVTLWKTILPEEVSKIKALKFYFDQTKLYKITVYIAIVYCTCCPWTEVKRKWLTKLPQDVDLY